MIRGISCRRLKRGNAGRRPGHDFFIVLFKTWGMIQRDEFYYLSEWGKAKVLQEYGTRIARRYEKKCSYELYDLDGFYVELKVHVAGYISTGYAIFNDTSRLDPYLRSIDISPLFT